MDKELKDKLLKCLCSALPYGVKFRFIGNTYDMIGIRKFVNDDMDWVYGVVSDTIGEPIEIELIKPYLKPMSSMTEEERRELNAAIFGDSAHKEFFTFSSEPSGIIYNGNDNCCFINIGDSTIDRLIDWLLEHHFDFLGLIPKGAAIVAPEGMYETN